MKVRDYMNEALQEARAAFLEEVLVGAVIENGEIIARSGNRCEQDNDPTAHAEVLAIKMAAKALGTGG